MTDALVVRPAMPADEDALWPLVRALHAHEHLPEPGAAVRGALKALLAGDDRGFVLVAEDHGQMVGYVVLGFGFSLEFHGRDALMDELYVREAHRGHGAGTLSLAFVEELCRTEGIRALHLEVDRSNGRAERLYHRAGYRDHDRYLLTKWLE